MTNNKVPRWLTVVTWVLQLLAAAAFLAAAAAKLAGVPMMVELFDQIGLGQWFRYVTAAVEITGGVALLVPRTAPWGAVLLAATMVCAVITHLFVVHTSPVGAVVLLAVVIAIAWLRRDHLSLGHRAAASSPPPM